MVPNQPNPSRVAALSAWKVLFWMCIAAVIQTVINQVADLGLPDWTVIPLTALLKAGASWVETRKIVKAVQSVLPFVLVGVLLCGCLAMPAQAQVTTQTITLPQVSSVSTTPISVTERSFSAAVFFDKHEYALAPIGTELWHSGKLHANMFALIKPDDDAQIAGNIGTGYDIDVSNFFRDLLKKPTLTVTVTPYWAFTQDITGDKVGKPFLGIGVNVKL